MLNKEKNTYRYVGKDYKMMYEKPEDWEPQSSKGEDDALIRTAHAYMAYGDKDLLKGILSCFKKEGKHYQAYRCPPDHGKDDVSRDQVIGALSSLLMRGNIREFKEIAPKLRFRLSKRYMQGIGMWLWIKQWWAIYGIVEFFSIIFGVLWNKLLFKILKRKTYTDAYYMYTDPNTGVWVIEDEEWVFKPEASWVNNGNKLHAEHKKKMSENWLYKVLSKSEYPLYGAMLTAYMVYCMPNSILRKVLSKVLLWNVSKENNLLLKAMFGRITVEEIHQYQPKNKTRWTSRFDGTTYFRLLEGEDALYNVIDKDLLYFFRNKRTKSGG